MAYKVNGVKAAPDAYADIPPPRYPAFNKKEIEVIERAEFITQQFILLKEQVETLGYSNLAEIIYVLEHQIVNAQGMQSDLVQCIKNAGQ